MNAAQRQLADRAEQRLHANETNRCLDAPEIADAGQVVLVLDAHPHPDVGRDRERAGDLDHALGAFRQDLKAVLRGASHHVEDSPDERVGHIVMEEIGHAVYEDAPGGLPAQR